MRDLLIYKAVCARENKVVNYEEAVIAVGAERRGNP